MTADPCSKYSPIRFEDLRRAAVSRLMQKHSEIGWTDEQVEAVLDEVERRVRDSLCPELQKAFQSSADDLDDKDVTNAAIYALRSKELLRFKPVPYWNEQRSRSAETIFEKNLAKEVGNSDEKTWANQVPIWSGIRMNVKKCNIDIGYVTSENAFCLCELKIRPTNDPLYAILELMTYIFGYLFVRKLTTFAPPTVREEIRDRSRGLLEAQSIEWCVIAPEDFYEEKIEGSGGVRLRPTELEQVRCVAQKHAEKMIEKLGFRDLRITLSLRCLSCKMRSTPIQNTEDGRKWISEVRGKNTLRDLISQAPNLLSSRT